ncbi:hypothetical protein [Thalassolituus oleivorans]|uniref:hypothetical protein n=1 Tax=Thalassolituus oleivorans TaxID=187493 RepID=UPI0023F152A8|nr:hypothetical protein [Thalassolituus oleivorans]
MRIRPLFVLMLLSVGAIAHAQPSDLEILKIQTIASCVDDVFYQGGYEDGDENRIALIDTMLTLLNLPPFDEEYLYLDVEYDGKVSSEVYYQCISADRSLLDETAEALGVAAH